MECSSAVKENLKSIREKLLFAATWMSLEIILSEVKSDRESEVTHLYLKNENLFTKQKQTHRLRKQIYTYQRGRCGEG